MSFYVALCQPGVANIKDYLRHAETHKFTAVLVPLNQNGLPKEGDNTTQEPRRYNDAFSDVMLEPKQWIERVIGMISDDYDCDAADEYTRINSEKALHEEFAMAEYLLSNGWVMVNLKSGNAINLARIVAEKSKFMNTIVRVPAYVKKIAQGPLRHDLTQAQIYQIREEEESESWHWWNNFRWVNDFSHKIKLCLEIDPDEVISQECLHRWLGEPLDSVWLPETIFEKQEGGLPTILDPKWEKNINLLIRAGVSFMINCKQNSNHLLDYTKIIKEMRDKVKIPPMVAKYADMIEIPLQPLHTNLNSFTYDVFEQDRVKYDLYQKAIQDALRSKSNKDKLVVMVLGGGRGPLVRAVLNARSNLKGELKDKKLQIDITVVEKNPNAVRTLENMNKKCWDNIVTIIGKDMRNWNPPEKADIIVSELLGSFGDNELSPECLDCAVNLLKSDGISIPSESVSYINPIMSSKLYAEVRSVVSRCKLGDEKYAQPAISQESGFVVMFKNVFNIDEPKECFKFKYPNKNLPSTSQHGTGTLNWRLSTHNQRTKKIVFTAKDDAVLHGIGGYFEATLFKDIKLSIHPDRHTKNMFSWFPMFFPFTDPVNVKKGDKIEIHFWRCVGSYKVWYEWCLAKPQCSHIHNLKGECHPIYLA